MYIFYNFSETSNTLGWLLTLYLRSEADQIVSSLQGRPKKVKIIQRVVKTVWGGGKIQSKGVDSLYYLD